MNKKKVTIEQYEEEKYAIKFNRLASGDSLFDNDYWYDDYFYFESIEDVDEIYTKIARSLVGTNCIIVWNHMWGSDYNIDKVLCNVEENGDVIEIKKIIQGQVVKLDSDKLLEYCHKQADMNEENHDREQYKKLKKKFEK